MTHARGISLERNTASHRRMGACTHLAARRWVQAPILRCTAALTLCATTLSAGGAAVDAAGRAFAAHCFSPYLTAQTAQDALTPSGGRFEFYDLRPFSSAAPSPVTGRAATPGTDRRCEVAVDGDATTLAENWLATGLQREGLDKRPAPVPDDFPRLPGLHMIAAAQLNPNRIAVVQVGVRQGPNGQETYINVERLTPLDGS